MPRILLVDDDPDVRELIREMLEADGHVVTEAINGAEVEPILRQSDYELLMLDILMPKKDGIETILDLRRDGHTVKIIAMSGQARDIRLLNFLGIARRLGADATLEKPFGHGALRRAIGEVLGRAQERADDSEARG
jgi:CheY-like chemotaxis protein